MRRYLLLVILLSGDVSTAHILVSASILPLTCWHSISGIINSDWLLMYIRLFWRLIFQQVLALIKVILSSHSSLGGGHPSLSFSACGGPPPVGSPLVIEIIEIVKHEVHVLLLLPLQMVYNSLVLVHLYPDVGIGLS